MIIPPLKIQGKKTKLIPFINECAKKILDIHPEIDTWIEPFMGTGVVSFNCPKRIKKVICADANPHIIDFYRSIKYGLITYDSVKRELGYYGECLKIDGYDYYLQKRKDFNNAFDPMDFLFLSRTSFNGMMRFNRKGEWNLPFCKINDRLNEKNVETLAKSVEEIRNRINNSDTEFEFYNLDFRKLINSKDIVRDTAKTLFYCDPPYLGLYTDYYCGWTEKDEEELSDLLSGQTFILSTWSNNGIKDNPAIGKYWKQYTKIDTEHFYNVAAKSENRRKITESLICNY